MLLSVIIVSYNVKFFLEQCLYSLEKALVFGNCSDQTEILVVDNQSSDGSLNYLEPAFPGVIFIANGENIGFARANNKALLQASGENVLFLNPDTILPEDFFSSCLSFLEAHPRTGALGVRMIDGAGRFLKESRRGFPSPWVAFCKLTGLTSLFPHSRIFATYYLGHLRSDEDHPAPILSGACFWARREALDKAGSFDERFFMYAEDIDLSHRIQEAGYTNYYLAHPTILHFKGESTRKDARYIKLFYKAMSQFRRKHFRGGSAELFNLLIDCAIWLRAGLTAVLSLFNPAGRRKPQQVISGSGTQTRIYITGDAEEVNRLTETLSRDPGKRLVTGKESADEIIFCEGQAFPFSEAIAALQNSPKGHSMKIHAAGSGSAVGSHYKAQQGQTIVLAEVGSGAFPESRPSMK